MPTLFGRAICCHTTGIPRFRLRIPDRLMECSDSPIRMQMQNPALLGRDVRLNARRGRFRLSTARAKAPKPLDAWFFEAQVMGCTCPRPVDWVVSRRSNRRLKRGGLSLGMRRVGPVCDSELQGGCAPVVHAAGIVL